MKLNEVYRSKRWPYETINKDLTAILEDYLNAPSQLINMDNPEFYIYANTLPDPLAPHHYLFRVVMTQAEPTTDNDERILMQVFPTLETYFKQQAVKYDILDSNTKLKYLKTTSHFHVSVLETIEYRFYREMWK